MIGQKLIFNLTVMPVWNGQDYKHHAHETYCQVRKCSLVMIYLIYLLRKQGGACEATDIDEDAALGMQGEEPNEECEKTRRLELVEKEMSLLRLENEVLRQRCASVNTMRATEVPTYRLNTYVPRLNPKHEENTRVK